MLLNLSNHPSSNWSKMQMDMAIMLYGGIEDLPFPQIDPNLDELQLKNLVQEYLNKIEQIKPKAVHIMGELTFCVALIRELQKSGIDCFASTTHRTTVDMADGTKVSKFEFVRFRNYSS